MSVENAVRNNDFTNEDTRTQIITDYEKLVKKLAIAFSRYGLDVDDLISEGNIGLMKAMEKFNPSLNVPFAAFARIWIKSFMRKALSRNSKTIRIPTNTRHNLSRVKKARLVLVEKLGREPVDKETADLLNISERTVRFTKSADIRTLSIHNPLGEDGGDYNDILPDDRPTHDKLLSDMETYERLENLVNALPANERTVIQQRYSGDPVTLDQIGAIIGKTHQRAGQIESEALGRLKGLMSDEVGAVR